jgi:uncharacterized protein YbjQ (UPF0145 family)
MLSSVKLLEDKKVKVINEYSGNKAAGYCNKCGTKAYDESAAKLQVELNSIQAKLQSFIFHIPMVTIQNPLNWNYEVLGMVTGQAVTGTGVISEFTSSFTDLFGAQSNRYNNKLKAGEAMCAAQLRKQTLDIGGNAIIGTDIDYSEVGGEKGMLMVCMAGTAVRLNNIELLSDITRSGIKELTALNERLKYLSALN